MTIAVDLGRKATKQTNQKSFEPVYFCFKGCWWCFILYIILILKDYSVNKRIESALFTYVPQKGRLILKAPITIADDTFYEIFFFFFFFFFFYCCFFRGGGGLMGG